MSKSITKKYIISIIQAVTMLFWILCLKDSDAYFMPYLVISIIAFVCFYANYREENMDGGDRKILLFICSFIFSIIVIAANYQLPNDFNVTDKTIPYAQIILIIYKFIFRIVLGFGGFFIAFNILCFAKKRLENFFWKECESRLSARQVFLIPFLFISILNIVLLFTCLYPGVVTVDSLSQMQQVLEGNYINHHPFYHTITIKLFVTIGMKIFGSINAGVATYTAFQILFMAMCFSIMLVTLYEMKISTKWIFLAAAWYAFMPFHLLYSFSMWKDVMFGGFVLLLIVYMFRLVKKLGKYEMLNYIMFFVSGLGVCLYRSNGFFAYVVVFIAFLFVFGKRYKKMAFIFASVIVVSFIMKHPVLNCLGVDQPDIIESLSIPAQQIARVQIEHNDFSEEERELLSNIVEIEKISNTYKPYISDPIKFLVRDSNNQKYIADNKLAFIKLYINTGLKHPVTYIKAWIDETKGYWNGGYDYWRWGHSVEENDLGIKQKDGFGKLLFVGYSFVFQKFEFLSIFLSIGFHVWICLFLFIMSIIRKDKIGAFIPVPIFAIVITLLISTPVFSEFRYIYSMFCSLPFILFVTFYKKDGVEEKS